MDTLNNKIISCLSGCGSSPIRAPARRNPHPHFQIVEKGPLPTPPPSIPPSNDDSNDIETTMKEIMTLLLRAEKPGPTLTAQLDQKIKEITTQGSGWTEWIAQKILSSLEDILRRGREKLGPAIQQAYNDAKKAADAVFQFAKDHPLAAAGLLTILAVGILVVMAPFVVEALGFAELGPLEGSFAAWWESTYAGFIPRGSLFSYLQRLGMVWGRALTSKM